MSLTRQAVTLNRLKAAFAKVRSNSGAAGVDGISPDDFGETLHTQLRALQSEVLTGQYAPSPLRRAWLRKEGKAPRPLAIPTVRDRVLQTAVGQILTPLFEAEFEDCSFAYRQGRSVRNAIERIGVLQRNGYTWVVDADITKFFDTVPHLQLNESVARVVSDKIICRLIALWIASPIYDEQGLRPVTQGIPQGSPISPMLSNLYLDHFDEALVDADLALVRYADDFVILTKTRPLAEQALELTEQVLKDLALGLNPLKTRIVNLDQGIDYLGWHVVGSFAVQKSRQKELVNVGFELTDLPATLDAQTLARERATRLEQQGQAQSQTKYQRLADQEAMAQKYLAQNKTLDNPALAEGLRQIVEQIMVVEAAPSEALGATANGDDAPKVFAYTAPEPLAVAMSETVLDLPDESADSVPPAKPLQRTLYLVEQGCELGKEGETFQVRRDGETLLELPARSVDLIAVFGNITLTTPAIQLAMRHQISVALLSQLGRYYGRIDAHDVSALNLQRAQLAVVDDVTIVLSLAKQFVTGKLANSRVVLGRYLRSRVKAHNTEEARQSLLRIRDAMQRIKTTADLNALRGLEGSAAVEHFAIMRQLLGAHWQFHKRARQPSPDAINALLSLGYTLLYQCVAGLLQARGLNPHVGLLHAGSGTHLALASDVMEEFRAVCVDALVLKLCATAETDNQNQAPVFGQIRAEGFQLDRKVVKQFIRLFEERLNTFMQHPITGEMGVDMRRIIDGQVLQLIRVFRSPNQAHYIPCVFR